jgi:hypothetical protein
LETIDSYSFPLLMKLWTARYAYERSGVTTESRQRLSKEIAQELRAHHGDGAYLYCLEKLSNNTEQPRLWRDVLSWLDEGVEDGDRKDGVVSDESRSGYESEKHEPSSG